MALEITLEEIFKLITFCKDNSVVSFKLQALEFYINDPNSIKVHSASNEPFMSTLPTKEELDKVMTTKIEELLKPLDPFADMSDEEILYAATPHFDELQAQKKLHQQKIDGESKT